MTILRACVTCGRLTEARYCPAHTPRPWESSTRREKVQLSGSKQQRRARAVMELHDGICHVCGYLGADQVDHVIPVSENGPDSMDNLRPIHAQPCHAQKTAREAARARARRHVGPNRKDHP